MRPSPAQMALILRLLVCSSRNGVRPQYGEIVSAKTLMLNGLLKGQMQDATLCASDMTSGLRTLLADLYPNYTAVHNLEYASWVFAPGLRESLPNEWLLAYPEIATDERRHLRSIHTEYTEQAFRDTAILLTTSIVRALNLALPPDQRPHPTKTITEISL